MCILSTFYTKRWGWCRGRYIKEASWLDGSGVNSKFCEAKSETFGRGGLSLNYLLKHAELFSVLHACLSALHYGQEAWPRPQQRTTCSMVLCDQWPVLNINFVVQPPEQNMSHFVTIYYNIVYTSVLQCSAYCIVLETNCHL